MTNIIPFDFNRHKVRVIEIDGEPWFVGKDVAEILGYSNPQKAIRTHCKKSQDIVGVQNGHPISSNELAEFRSKCGMEPTAKIIPEPDVYRLIMRSKRPEAEAFEELVVGKILPTIRRTGGYGAPALDLNNPAQLRGLLSNYAERTEIAESKVAELEPKAEVLAQLEASEDSVTPRVAAKVLDIPERKFFKALYAIDWAYKQGSTWLGYADKIKAGYLEHEPRPYRHPVTGEDRSSIQLKITTKGMARLAKRLGGDHGLTIH